MLHIKLTIEGLDDKRERTQVEVEDVISMYLRNKGQGKLARIYSQRVVEKAPTEAP